MVRMFIDNTATDADTSTPSSHRSSLAWDSTRKPRKSILKRRTLRRTVSMNLTLPMPTQDSDGDNATTEHQLQETLNALTLSEPMVTDSHRSTSPNTSVTVKASTLYGNKCELLRQYDVSTMTTIRYGLSNQRIQRLRNHESLISFVDIYDLPALLKEVVSQYPSVISRNVSIPEMYNDFNDFYCNAYWVVKLTDTIVELLFEKLCICLDSVITYRAASGCLDNTLSIPDITHNIKAQVSLCDWMTNTIAPNYIRGDVSPLLGVKLRVELEKLASMLTCSNYQWIDYAVRMLC